MGKVQALRGAVGGAVSLRPVAHERIVDDLAVRARAGDQAAFTALMRAHKDDLYRFVRRRLANAEDAYDVVQEAFVSAWGAIDRLDPNRPFVAWLRAIALNKIRDRARRTMVRRGFWGTAPIDAEQVADGDASPEEITVARDQLIKLKTALGRLPAPLREALMLTAVDGLSQSAAAAVLNCSIKAIEYRVHRAREMLACELKF